MVFFVSAGFQASGTFDLRLPNSTTRSLPSFLLSSVSGLPKVAPTTIPETINAVHQISFMVYSPIKKVQPGYQSACAKGLHRPTFDMLAWAIRIEKDKLNHQNQSPLRWKAGSEVIFRPHFWARPLGIWPR